MIRLESISKTYPDGDLFHHVSFSILRGMRAGLVGPNGSGKTTLLRIMLGEETPDSGSIQLDKGISIGYLAQDIVVGSNKPILEEVLSSNPEIRDLEGKMISLSHAITTKPNDLNLVNQLGEAQTRFEALGGWSLEKKAKRILGGLGFNDEQMIEPMEVFSGGWRMRVALAAILLKEPDILFLDEPTNHLDLEATLWLESFLSDWNGSLVMISHDRAFLDRSVNTILEIDLKKITLYHGNYSQYKIEKALRLEQHRNAYKNQQKQIQDTERFIERFRYKNTKASQVQSRMKMLEKLDILEAPSEDSSTMNLQLPQPDRPPQQIATFRNVKKHYGNIHVFDHLNLSIERGQKIGLVGHNGAGKSTLLKMLAGVEKTTSGAIRIGSKVDYAYYAQHQLETLNSNDTVFESIQKVSPGWSESDIRSYLGRFMFSGDEIEKLNKVLSGGEKARVALACMLVQPSHLLLLDEPTNHLDMVTRNIVENALAGFSGSIVCISHDRHFLNQVTNLTYEVGEGTVRIYDGNYDYYSWKKGETEFEIQTSPNVESKPKEKTNYKERKKVKNRLAWIDRRFKSIETEIEVQREITQDPKNGDNYSLLQEAMESMNQLESEYLDLMEEQELLMIHSE